MGTIAIFAKMAYSFGATPLTMLTIRFGMASIMLWGYLYWQKQIEKIGKKQLLSFALLGVVYGLSSLLFFVAITLTSASIATLLLYTAPVFVVVISVLIGDERLTIYKLISVIITTVGLYLVLDLSVDTVNLKGVLVGMGSGFFYCLFIVGGNRFSAGINPLLVTACTIPATFVFHLCVSLATNQLHLAQPPLVWVYGALMALFGTAIGIGFIYKAVQLVGASKTAIITAIEPAITIALAAIIFSERMSLLQFIGGALIIGAIIIINVSKAQTVSEEGVPEQHRA